MSALAFTEEMKGHVAFGATDFADGERRGIADGTSFMFHLTIRTEDVQRFADDPRHPAGATGWIACARLGGRCAVERGAFNLFVDAAAAGQKRMLYRLWFSDAQGRALTMTGFKDVKDDGLTRIWHDTSTLYVRLYEGHVEEGRDEQATLVASGILHILEADFIRQLTTIRIDGASFADRLQAARRFGGLFLGSLWDVYGTHAFPAIALEPRFQREIPLFTHEGVHDATHSHVAFSTGDGLGLSLERFQRCDADDVVVVIHGLTTSTDMFIMPEHYNLVSWLLDHGYGDVWTLDFRMSNRHPYNLHRHRYTMDHVALFDFPAAIAEVRAAVGPTRRVHVICHCLGANAFMMGLFAKTVTGITSVVANSVALTPRVPRWSFVKLTFAPAIIEYLLDQPYLDPAWADTPGLTVGKLISKVVSWFHHECDVPACHMLSLLWGTGWPALYRHENLLDVTHRRGGDLYGATSVHYYRHVRRQVASDNTAVKYDPKDPRLAALPDNYFDHAKEITTPVLLMTGQENHVFTDSNILCHQRLEQLVPGRHRLLVIPGYGHQDVFMGKNNHLDVFPRLGAWLDEHRGARRTVVGAAPSAAAATATPPGVAAAGAGAA